MDGIVIDAWYFCCCLELPLRRASPFLAMLDALSGCDGLDVATRAVAELRKTDIWMRLYASRRCLELLNKSPGGTLGIEVRQLFQELAATLDGQETAPARRAVERCLDGNLDDATLAELCRLAAAHGQARKNAGGQNPYVELREKRLATLTMLFFAHAVHKDARRWTGVLASESADSLSIAEFLRQASEGSHGRMAFLSSLQVARTTQLFSTEVLISKLRNHSEVGASEPDLLTAYAELCFGPNGTKEMMMESVTFVRLRRWVGDKTVPLNPVLPEELDNERRALPCILWQCVLWEMASQSSPAEVLPFLPDLWAPPGKDPTSPILMARLPNMQTPEPVRSYAGWMLGLRHIQVKGPKGKPEPARLDFGSLPNGESFAWTCYSPWLRHKSAHYHMRDEEYQYPESQKRLLLLRLLWSSVASSRILSFKDDTTATTDGAKAAAALLIHAFDVMQGYRSWLNAHDAPRPAGSSRELPENLTLLMLLARARALRCVRTRSDHPTPEVFLDARAWLMDFTAGAKNIRAFCSSVAPSVLVQWVLDAFVAAVDESGPGRWLSASTAISEIALSSRIPYSRQVDALLLQRFFGNEACEVPSECDWRYAEEGPRSRSRWDVSHRKLLLLPNLPPSDWDRPEWPEPSTKSGDDAEPSRDPKPVQYLVRAIERRASIRNRIPGEQEFPESWRREWLEELRSIATPTRLDRLIRVRLVEMLREPTLELDEQEQVAICAALVEWASLYEIVRMFEEVFRLEATGTVIGASDLARQRARSALLFASAQFVHSFRVQEGQRGGEEPENPYALAEREEKVRLIESYLLPVAAQGAWPGGDISISREFAKLQRRRLKEAARTDSFFESEYIVGPSGPYIEGAGIPPSWSVKAAAFDANTESVAAVYAPFRLDGAIDMFSEKELSFKDLERMKDSERHRLFGIVFHDRRGDEPRLFVNWGFRTPIGLPDGLKKRFPDGTPIIFQPERVTRDGHSFWRVNPQGEISSALNERAQNSRVMVRVEYDGHPICSLPFVFEIGGGQLSINISDWNSAFYRSTLAETVDGVIAEFGADKRWKPVVGDMLELLTREFPGPESSPALLRFVRDVKESSGVAKWQFMTRPGLVYNLEPACFSEESRQTIAATIEAEQNAVGIEFSVHPVYLATDKVLVLELRAPEGSLTVRRGWIEWINAFDQADYVEIEQRGAAWYHRFREPIPGYPKSVPVEFRSNRRPKLGPVFAAVESWDFRKGILRVAFEERRLNVRDRQAFVGKWLALRLGDRLQVSKTFGKVDSSGYLRGLTLEDAVVLVEAESVSFAFDRESRVQQRTRTTVVTSIDRVRELVRVSVDPEVWPKELSDLRRGDGIIAAVQSAEETSSVPVEIWWYSPQGITSHRMELPSRYGIFPGVRVEFSRLSDSVEVVVSSWSIRVRALWQESNQIDHDRVLFLGPVQLERADQCIAEVAAGEFCFVDSGLETPHLSEGHLSKSGEWTFDGPGLSPDQRVINSAKGPSWSERKIAYRRAMFATPKGALTGICEARSFAGTSTAMVFMSAWQHEDGLWEIRRLFEFAACRLDSRVASEADEATLWQERLDEYFDKPRPVTVEALEGAKVRLKHLRVPVSDTQGRIVWAPEVVIGAGEGPYIRRAPYPRAGQATLYVTPENQFRVSFRRSEPLDPAGYAKHLGAQLDVKTPLKNLLRYVGPLRAENAARHRFEWGLGYVLEADETDLRFDGGPFKKARGILFHGDGVRSIRFHRDAETQRVVVSLEEVNLEYSVPTRLYRQSQAGVVHLLSLGLEDERVKIAGILGAVESDMAPSQTFVAPEAVLDGASERRLLPRLLALPADDDRSRVLGRLDKHAFETSFGEEVVFRHLKMTFQLSSGADMLKDGDFVFMRAGRIKAFPNDVGLELEPEGLAKEDIGPDFKRGCLLLRREYSCREENLPQILDRQGPVELEGELYLARLYKRLDGNVGASLTDARTPTRRESVLLSLISDSKSAWLAVVVDARNKMVQLEVKPGVHFRLKTDSLRLPTELLTKGTVLRLQSNEDTVTAVVARFPDDKYIGDGVRDVVCLPKNTLLDPKLPFDSLSKQPHYWGRSLFTVANLPGIEAIVGTCNVDGDRWSTPNAVEGQKLMRTRHPKLAILGKDLNGNLRIAHTDSRTYTATLRFEKTSVFLERSGKRSRGQWSELTFSDEPAKRLVGRFSQERWPLHDRKTGYWMEDGLRTEELTLESAAGPSPMFFEKRSSSTQCLRYSSDAFFRFGYPVSALFRSLEGKPSKRGHYAIAAPARAGGVWVEICPGRICEVPAQLLVLLVDGTEVSLANFEWSLFSAGDEVTLRLRTDRSSSVDKVELLRWIPRPRSAYGNSRLFLPLQPFDSENGCQPIGRGAFQIDLPMDEPPPFQGAAVLDELNRLLPFESGLPNYGDIVLLELDSADRVRVAALPGFVPVADRMSQNAWAGDPLQPLAETRLSGLVRACGGSLPVTVEACIPGKKMLFFSRRLQRTGGHLEPGKLAAGFILGLMPDGVTALIQIGAAIRPFALPRLIPGLPPERCADAAEKLRGIPLWFHQTADKLEFGIGHEKSSEFLGEILQRIDAGNPDTQGFVCRSIDSLRLYWLGALEAAWTRIEGGDLDLVGQRKGLARLVSVALMGRNDAKDGVSMIRTAAAKREFRESNVGRELVVTPVVEKLLYGRRSYLAFSETTGLLLSCDPSDEDGLVVKRKLRTEVVSRREGASRHIAVVPFGKRLHIVNLPNPLLLQERSSFASFIEGWETPLPQSLAQLDRIATGREPAALAVACRFLARGVPQAQDVRRLREIAEGWWSRNQAAAEIQPHLALSALLILDSLGRLPAKELSAQTPNYSLPNWHGLIRKLQRTAVMVFQDLALRAAASVHFEVFAGYLSAGGRSALGHDFERRFAEVHPLLSPRIPLSTADTVRAFCGAIRLRSDRAAYPLASSLLVALGDTRELFRLATFARTSAPIASELLGMYRAVPRSANGSIEQLPAGHRRRAEMLLERIVHQRLNLFFGLPMASRPHTEQDED